MDNPQDKEFMKWYMEDEVVDFDIPTNSPSSTQTHIYKYLRDSYNPSHFLSYNSSSISIGTLGGIETDWYANWINSSETPETRAFAPLNNRIEDLPTI